MHEHGLYGLQIALIGVMVALRVLFAAGSYCRQNAECPRLRRYARRLEFLVGYAVPRISGRAEDDGIPRRSFQATHSGRLGEAMASER